ncbi:MAG: alcohol dehydrogenase catalytic domain-containing protein [Anaerolineae bacterium]|nr:alcohol dehydrogenase catalytic domain-containing protein [Anaerolineae bacterium]
MRAFVVDKGIAGLQERPIPEPADGEALLRIRRAGICNTDLEIIRGYMQFSGVLGHEFVAEVVACPSDTRWLGKRVVGEINVPCDNCDFCSRGIPSHCRNRTTVGIDRHDGAFADYMTLLTKCLHLVPDSISDDEAVFVEPLAAALQVTELEPVHPDSEVVLVGAGKLGILTAQVLQLTGANLRVVIRSYRPVPMLEKLGLAWARLEDLPRKQADVVVECTGNESGFNAALELVKPRGSIVLKSTYVGSPNVNLTKVVVDEIRLIGNRCGPFDSALKLLESGKVNVLPLIDSRYSLDDVSPALERAAAPGALKVLLEV